MSTEEKEPEKEPEKKTPKPERLISKADAYNKFIVSAKADGRTFMILNTHASYSRSDIINLVVWLILVGSVTEDEIKAYTQAAMAKD